MNRRKIAKQTARDWMHKTARNFPSYVYHATPYRGSIMREGFKLKDKQTFGGHQAEYISTTTERNARHYGKALKLAVMFFQTKMDWDEFKRHLKDFGVDDGKWRMFFHGGDVFYHVVEVSDQKDRIWDMDRGDRIDYVMELAMNQKTPDGDGTSFELEQKRRYALIGEAWNGTDFPLFMKPQDSKIPHHWNNINPSNIGVVAARVRADSELTERDIGGLEDGNVTYNSAEQEWRFFEPDLLEPISGERVKI
jgi:hypothetical protein